MISKFRLQAVFTHLLFSCILIGAITFISLSIWFPNPFYEIDGTLKALTIVFCVDIVLGPVITMVVSNNNKSFRELLFDFSVVLALQVAALAFGISEIYQQRVHSLMHIEDKFHLVAHAAVPEGDPPPELPNYNGIYYGMLTYLELDGLTDEEREAKIFSPSGYSRLSLAEVKAYSLPLAAVPETLLEKFGENVYYKIVAGKNKNGVAVIGEGAEILDIQVLPGATPRS